jgi:spore coat polysaccharide biosynthesis protein SpsF
MKRKDKKRPRVVASIEARMGSSRLPGKVLADVNGQPALKRLITRLKKCKYLDDIVLATSTSPGDDILEEWAKGESILCYRGSEDNVLKRVVDANIWAESDLIVEITGDCILTDTEVVDMGIKTFLENECDVVTNCGTYLSYPMGIYVQVFRTDDLRKISETINDEAVREHVSLYFYEHPEIYKIINLVAPNRWANTEFRFQLDYPEDLELLNKIYQLLEPKYGDDFGIEEIMQLMIDRPDLSQINIHCEEKLAR